MTNTTPQLALFRVTLEALSPLSIGGEDVRSYFDMNIARDANGLPTIPGSSIAGVLRHMTEDRLGSEKANRWFGFNDQMSKIKRQDARLKFSFGYVHDTQNNAVRGVVSGEKFREDKLLNYLTSDHPLKREHVAINARGVTDGRGKYERIAAPKGTRFSFEVSAWLKKENSDVELEEIYVIIKLLRLQEFRLGGSTRRGYGQVKVDNLSYDLFCASKVKEIREARKQVPSFELATVNKESKQDTSSLTININLTPQQFWRIGSGDKSFTFSNDGKEADLLPLTEPQIKWADNVSADVRGELYQNNDEEIILSIPASSIKGALRHRTLFHYNRLSNRMIDMGKISETFGDAYQINPDSNASQENIDNKLNDGFGTSALEALFGSAKERKGDDGITQGQRGLVIIDDAEIAVSKSDIIRLEHNSIDRFTGGVLTGHLYSEELASGKEFDLKIVLLPFKTNNEENKKIIQAFSLAIEDLAGGRLAIGAKSHGFCQGKVSIAGSSSPNSDALSWKDLFSFVENENEKQVKEIENA